MSKKLIQGKLKKSKTKKMSHTGGNSRPLENVYFDTDNKTWYKSLEKHNA